MMLRPLESYDQQVLSSSIVISPTPSRLHYAHDVFGNCVGVAQFAIPTRELIFDSKVTLRHAPVAGFDSPGSEGEVYNMSLPFTYSADDLPDLARSMEPHYPDPDHAVDRWARSFLRTDGRTGIQHLLTDMTQTIHADFRYRTRLHGHAQSPTETLATRSGACRDFAILMMEAVRRLGFAAQFVSGYIRTVHPAGASSTLGGGHTHAWMRAYLPECGWVEFDPTSGIVGNGDLVRVAIARDPRQALPLHGTWRGQSGDFLGMEVSVDVVSITEAVQ